MRYENRRDAYANNAKTPSYWSRWPDLKNIDDRESFALIEKMTATLLGFLDADDADILSRADLTGQTVEHIARETGRTVTDVEIRLREAREHLCRFVILTLRPLEKAVQNQSKKRFINV